MKEVVAIIPARGGSKGIPKKNLAPFCGKPLIAWSIEQALGARGVSSVWVTSDSDAILKTAQDYGARPILRPETLSTDTASSESAWEHALAEIEKTGVSPDLILGMQATSPLRESSDIERALTDFEKQGCDSLFSGAHIEDFFLWTRDGTGNLRSLNYDSRNRKRRQDFAEQFVENGSFYLFTPAVLRKLGNRLGGKIGISKMAFWKSFEIDSLAGLEMCEVLMRHYLLKAREERWRPLQPELST